MPSRFLKSSDAKLEYEVDWGDWLDGDTIISSSWVVPSGITILSESNTTTIAKAKLGGGTIGQSYQPVNKIITAAGLEDERTITIKIVPK